jgi:hypothetical protein
MGPPFLMSGYPHTDSEKLGVVSLSHHEPVLCSVSDGNIRKYVLIQSVEARQPPHMENMLIRGETSDEVTTLSAYWSPPSLCNEQPDRGIAPSINDASAVCSVRVRAALFLPVFCVRARKLLVRLNTWLEGGVSRRSPAIHKPWLLCLLRRGCARDPLHRFKA